MLRKAAIGVIVVAAAAAVAGVAQATVTATPRHWSIVTLSPPGTPFSYAEPGISVAPNETNLMVVAATADTGAPPTFWISENAGGLWSGGQDFDMTGSSTGDADALIGPEGYRYALNLGYNPNPHQPANTRVLVFRSYQRGPWSGPASFPTHGLDQPDRPWLVAKPHSAELDVVYTQGGSSVYMWRSMDHGERFTGPIPVTRGAGGHPAVALSSRPLFDPTQPNRLFMLYETTGSAKIPAPHGPVYEIPLTQLWLATSTDDGRTWSNRRVLGGGTGPLNGAVIGHSLVASAIDRRGDLYAVFSARLKGATKTTVYLMHSENHGQNWSSPSALESPTASNVMPALAVNPHGTAYVSWYGSASSDFRSPKSTWREMFASTRDPLVPHSHFDITQVSGSKPVHVGGIDAAGALGDETGANWGLRDFQSIAVALCGAPMLVWADDNGVKATEFARPRSICN